MNVLGASFTTKFAPLFVTATRPLSKNAVVLFLRYIKSESENVSTILSVILVLIIPCATDKKPVNKTDSCTSPFKFFQVSSIV